MVEARKTKRTGLISTNSIRGGANRRVLDRVKKSGDMFLAWSDRPWVLDGAAVRVAIVGFDDGTDTERMLDGVSVSQINPDLTGDTDVTQACRLTENANLAFMCDTKVGAFDLTNNEAKVMLYAPINPNGRTNYDVIRPWVNGLDVTRRPRNMWIIDFGTSMTVQAAALYEKPFEHIVARVKPDRDKNTRNVYRNRWWLHGESRPSMRAALAKVHRFTGTPTVAKHRLFIWLEAATLPDHQIIAIARDDDYFFGVLHSRLHEVWSLRQGTSLEDRPRYTPSSTFETFPFPWPPGSEPKESALVEAISVAARDLVTERAFHNCFARFLGQGPTAFLANCRVMSARAARYRKPVALSMVTS